MKDQPEPCIRCGAPAALRKNCIACGEGIWVVEHQGHYLGGREVIQCSCVANSLGKPFAARKRRMQRERKIRDTGIVPDEKHKSICTPEMAKKAAQGLAKGLPISKALREAGFPESTAHLGKRGINHMVRAELKTLGRKYMEMGRDLSPEDQEALVRGRLMENAIIGTDKGVLSVKQLGADKRVAMWQPDSQVGLVVLQAPQIRKIAHEVPLLPPEPEEEAG